MNEHKQIVKEPNVTTTLKKDWSPEVTADSGGAFMDCLETICKFHGINIFRSSILAGLPLSDGELSPNGFDRAAKKAGFSSRTVKRSITQINSALLPAVLVLNDNQACVLISIDKENETAEVVFPELHDSREQVSFEFLQSRHSGYVIFVRPIQALNAQQEVVDARPNKHWFWGVVGSAKPLYRDVIIASIFINVLSIALPLFVMNVYDRVVPNAAMDTLWVLAIGVIMVLSADFFLRILRHYFVELAASRIDVSLSSTLFNKVLGIKIAEKPASTGSFVNSMQSFDAIRGFLNSMTLVSLVDLPLALVFVTIIGFINGYLMLPILIGGIIILGYGAYAQKAMGNLAAEAINISSKRSGLITETVTALEEVKLFGAESKMQYEWEKLTIYLAKVNAKIRLIGASVNSAALWFQQSVGISIMVLGVYLILDGQITQGGLIAAYLLSSRAMSPISMAAGLLAQFHHAATALRALNDLMLKDEENSSEKRWTQHTQIRGDITFKQVGFHYPDQNMRVLNNVSFTIKAGEHVAIIGKNGCGKSSINRLLLKTHSAQNGLVTLDNINLEQYQPNILRRAIGYVPQDVVLFSGTLRDNIYVSEQDADEDRLWEIIEAVGMADFVNSHPDGLNLNVGEKGSLLSGGQRQAIAIARALIKDPQVMILDEPSSALDSGLEQKIKTLLQRELKNKTVILNTHKTVLLDLVERIIVLENGKVTADGPKDKVLKQISPIQPKPSKN